MGVSRSLVSRYAARAMKAGWLTTKDRHYVAVEAEADLRAVQEMLRA
jgi:hypothetical protein